MDKSSPDEQHGCVASHHQILPKGSHGNAETLESKLTEIDATIRNLNENFDICRRMIGDMISQRDIVDVQLLRLFSHSQKWLKSLHEAENYRRNLIEMALRGLDKNRKKSNDRDDGPVMSAGEAKEMRDQLDQFTNAIMENMVVQAKLETKVRLDKIDHINKREAFFELAAGIARQRRLAIDIRNALMAIKNTMKDEN